jgi:hypothetical protein
MSSVLSCVAIKTIHFNLIVELIFWETMIVIKDWERKICDVNISHIDLRVLKSITREPLKIFLCHVTNKSHNINLFIHNSQESTRPDYMLNDEIVVCRIDSYWLTKEWTANCCLSNLDKKFISLYKKSHLLISLSHDSSRFLWESRSSFCHENFFFWSSYLRASLSLRSDFIKIAYSFSCLLISRRSRKSVNMKEIISIEWS